jgi:uncharacterized membrane protein YjgN (DUF898 family)
MRSTNGPRGREDQNNMQSTAILVPERQRYPITFTATGSEYFRIWIVNLLLILLTFGLYLPWARVRKFQYFYRNTRIADDALDFHGNPRKMLRGTLIAAAFLGVYGLGNKSAGWAALVAAIAFVALWPALFRASMRFRLANTSWRGLRFRFAGGMAGAYACMALPLGLALLPLAVAGLVPLPAPDQPVSPALLKMAAATGLLMLLFVAALPYFLWRVRGYQHGHYAYGDQQTRLDVRRGAVYGVFFRFIGLSLLGVVVLAVVIGIGFKLGAESGVRAPETLKRMATIGVGGTLIAFYVLSIFPKAYLQVRLQNLFWSKTGNGDIRFKSDLRLLPYVGLQYKNQLLIGLTLGLYWPFAVVNTRRAQVEAVELRTRIGLDQIVQTAQREDPNAVGDMAADLFGMDIGL